MNNPTTLPLEPLEFYCRNGVKEEEWTEAIFAQMINVTTRTLYRWRHVNDGEIPYEAGDKAAVACGVHPIAIWGEAWEDLDWDIYHGEKTHNPEIEKALKKVGRIMEKEAALA